MLNKEIFREYDIRGIADRDLTPIIIESLGRAFAEYLGPKKIQKVTIGYDARLSSRRVRDNLIAGLTASGITVVDLGLCPTPVLYFSLYHLNPGAGVMITGSHNPPEFNGFKLCVDKDTIYGEEIQKIKKIMQSAESKGQSVNTKYSAMSQEPRAVSQYKILPVYVDNLVNRFTEHRSIPIKVVLDSGNGTAGLCAPEILRKIGCEVVELFSEPDGRFPNHHPDPTIPKYLDSLIQTVRREHADLGIAFDGDADRIGVVDEAGQIIWGDQLMILFARDMLSTDPNSKFLSEVKCSQVMYDDIRSRGGDITMWKAGHSLLRAKMKEIGAGLAGEMSGHMFFADRYLGYDDAIYAACRVIEILKKEKSKRRETTMSSLLSNIPKTFSTPEIRIDCPDDLKFRVVEQLKQTVMGRKDHVLQPKEVITIDGIRAVFERGWALVRASNTQPVLVMRFEASDPNSLADLKRLMHSILEKIFKKHNLIFSS